ncbi:extracellular solute-binding protein [Streptomyces sp. NPDC002643]
MGGRLRARVGVGVGTRARGRARAHGPARVRALARVRVLSCSVVLVLAACTGGGDGDGETDDSESPSSDHTIVVASGRDVTGKGGVRQQLIEEWNKSSDSDGYKARLVELPGSADQQRSQLLGALQSGSASYDVVNLDITWVPEFAAARLIRPFPDDVVEAAEQSEDDFGDFVDPVDKSSFWDGERYAVPFNSDVGLLYYRRDHLRAADTDPDLDDDGTWDGLREMIDDVEALNDKRPARYEKGWTTQLDAYEGRTVNAIEAFASAVEDFALTDDDGRYRATEEQLAEGITELRERTVTAYTLEDAYESDEAASLSDFAQGRTTFLRHWPYAYPGLDETFGADLGVTRLPGRAVLGGQNLAVTRTTSDDRAAKAAELIRFLTDPDSERCLLNAGFAATRASAYEDDARCTHAPAYADTPSASPTGEGTGRRTPAETARLGHWRGTLLSALKTAVHRPRTPLYGAVTQVLINELGPLYEERSRGEDGERPRAGELAKRLHEALKEELPD